MSRSQRNGRGCCCDGEGGGGVIVSPEPPPGHIQPRCGDGFPPLQCSISDFTETAYAISVESDARPAGHLDPNIFGGSFDDYTWWQLLPTTIDIELTTVANGYVWEGTGPIEFFGERVVNGIVTDSATVEVDGLFENVAFCPAGGLASTGCALYWGEGVDTRPNPQLLRRPFRFAVRGNTLGPYSVNSNPAGNPNRCGLFGTATQTGRTILDFIDTASHGASGSLPSLLRYPITFATTPPTGHYVPLAPFAINGVVQENRPPTTINFMDMTGFRFAVL